MQERNRKRRRAGFIFPAIVLLLATAAGPPPAAAAGAFAGLEGVWSGDGAVKLTDGSTAKLRCRAVYSVSGGGDHLDQSIDCANGAQSFAFRIALDQTGGAILGFWRELTKQVEGGVSGQVAPGKLQLVARTQGFTAQATVVTRGARQTLAIAANSGGLSAVSIALRRSK